MRALPAADRALYGGGAREAARVPRLGILGQAGALVRRLARAELLIIGLAPGAHGSNRTGRMFTGDGSGNVLYRVLHQTGFASQPESVSRDDGQRLIDAYITAVARCAPPGNKPTREEIANCRPYLERELDLLHNVKVVVALGRVAFDNYLGILQRRGLIRSRAAFAFGHNRVFETAPGQPVLIGLLSSQPAEHVHRQADGGDAGCGVPARQVDSGSEVRIGGGAGARACATTRPVSQDGVYPRPVVCFPEPRFGANCEVAGAAGSI